jgi:glycosyltransferase involved in cell wall biosynthesis
MKLSIITVNYNDAKGLQRTIESVLCQTFHDYEFIVIDGGSTDGSVEVIKRYEKYIDYWVSEQDGGIYPGMNKGLRQAKGEYVNFMNGGDCYHSSDVLEKIFSFDTNADIITGAHAGSPHPNVGQNGISMYDLYTGAVDHQASFIRRELAMCHPYDEKYKIVSDWKFFIEALVLDNCSFYYTDTIVVDVDMGGISNTNSELDRKERQSVLKELFPERVLNDYRLYASIHPRLLELTTRISKSQTILSVIIKMSKLLLWLKGV